jgi:zinc transporter
LRHHGDPAIVADPVTARPAQPPLPAHETVLICGFHLAAPQPPRQVTAAEIPEALAGREGVDWLHFGLSNARAARLLRESTDLPDAYRERVTDMVPRADVENTGDGLVMVVNDLSFDSDADAGEVETLWAYATPRLLVTARNHALKSTDVLRQALREGHQFGSGIELLAALLEVRTRTLRDLAARMTAEVDDIEDEILLGDIPEKRERLGVIRRRCARIRRHFVPDRMALRKELGHRHAWMSDDDAARLGDAEESLAYVLDEINEIYDRSKLLQEELASRVAENTGKRLYVLSILSAILLPMTLVTGIFGMNVAGVPGVDGEPAAFFWTMVGVVAAGMLTLLFLRWKRLL